MFVTVPLSMYPYLYNLIPMPFIFNYLLLSYHQVELSGKPVIPTPAGNPPQSTPPQLTRSTTATASTFTSTQVSSGDQTGHGLAGPAALLAATNPLRASPDIQAALWRGSILTRGLP